MDWASFAVGFVAGALVVLVVLAAVVSVYMPEDKSGWPGRDGPWW